MITELQPSLKDDYRIENPGLEPIVILAVDGGSLEFTVSCIVDYAQRTLLKDRLFTKVADEIANSQGRLVSERFLESRDRRYRARRAKISAWCLAGPNSRRSSCRSWAGRLRDAAFLELSFAFWRPLRWDGPPPLPLWCDGQLNLGQFIDLLG